MRYIAGDGGSVLSGDSSRSQQRLDLVVTYPAGRREARSGKRRPQTIRRACICREARSWAVPVTVAVHNRPEMAVPEGAVHHARREVRASSGAPGQRRGLARNGKVARSVFHVEHRAAENGGVRVMLGHPSPSPRTATPLAADVRSEPPPPPVKQRLSRCRRYPKA
jgi:hypothetical protein